MQHSASFVGKPFQLATLIGRMHVLKPLKELLFEVCQLFILLLVIPVTNAVRERCFSALGRVKLYLR